MSRASRPRRGLSTVVTSMILLVAAVLMAFAVANYATNATKTRSTTEEVRFSKESIWMNLSGAVVAFKIQNIGGADLTVDGVIVRDVELNWEALKQEERQEGESLLSSVPREMPALAYSQSIQRRVAGVGFDWDKVEEIIDKLAEEVAEINRASDQHEMAIQIQQAIVENDIFTPQGYEAALKDCLNLWKLDHLVRIV